MKMKFWIKIGLELIILGIDIMGLILMTILNYQMI